MILIDGKKAAEELREELKHETLHSTAEVKTYSLNNFLCANYHLISLAEYWILSFDSNSYQ